MALKLKPSNQDACNFPTKKTGFFLSNKAEKHGKIGEGEIILFTKMKCGNEIME
jgi:hypothetical protein